jgi:hypothetical protein
MTNRELRHENVPAEAVLVLARQLEALGARVAFEAELAGVCHHPSGTMRFTHVGDMLLIEVLDHKGHFPDKMVIGGIRQMIEEAVQMVKRSGGRPESLDVQPNRRVANKGAS